MMMKIRLMKLNWIKCVFIFFSCSILLNLLNLDIFSQSEIKFERVTVEGGDEPDVINSILQDRNGFLWLGTSTGLVRYDGYNFKWYTNDPQVSTSLSNNKVLSIYEDRKGNMWIGTEKGLNKFNRNTGYFSHYLINLEISPILEDKEGDLWIGTYGIGLVKMTSTATTVTFTSPTGLSHNNVRTIYEDENGILWIGTDGGGLNRFDKKKELITYFKHDPQDPGSISDDHVITIIGDKAGILWIGTDGGLDKLDTSKPNFKFTHYKNDSNNPHSLSHNRVCSIYIDSYGVMWIGTRGGGLNRLENETFYRYRHIRLDPFSLSGNMINAIHEDKSGILWIGTLGNGLNKYNRRTSIFKHYHSNPNLPGTLKQDVILSLYEDRSGTVWVGTFGEGLAKFDRQNGNFTHYKYPCQKNDGDKCNMVLSIYEDSRGTLWVGTDGSGLGQFNRHKKQFSYYRYNKNIPTSLSNNTILAIYEDVSRNIWIGTEKGLNQFDRLHQRFIHYYSNPKDKNSLSGDYVMSILEEPNEIGSLLWIGIYNGGLNQFDRQKGRFTIYKHDLNIPKSLSNNNPRCIFRDSSGTLWIGTDYGLNKFNRDKDDFDYYKEKDGLAGDAVYGILEDHAHRLWLSTDKGLSRFDPINKEFKNYDMRDGTQHNKFNNGAYMKSRTGEMFFGGINGFNVFDPDKLTDNMHIPSIQITDFHLLFNKAALKSPDPGVLDKKIFAAGDEVILNYKDYFLSIEFSGLDFTIPGKNRYRYKLEGVDPDWIKTDAGKRSASYMNLAPGTYIFRVQGSNNDEAWNLDGMSLKIIVLPPFWLKWWFLTMVTFFLALCIIAIFQWRTRRLRKARDEMEHARDMAEFRNAENEKLINAISSIFIAVKSNGSITQWNRPAEKFFGVPGNEAKKQSFVQLLKKYISPNKLDEIIRLGLFSDKSSHNIEIQVHLENFSEPKLLLTNINPIIMDRSGKTFGFLLLGEDITHRKKEEMLRDISQKLEALGQMAAGIAHEIRSPLQFIGDNGQFLLEASGGLIQYCQGVRDFIKEMATTGEKPNPERLKQWPDNSDIDYYITEIPKASEQIVAGVARVSDIVKSMNEFAHTGDGTGERANLNELIKSTLVVAHNRLGKVAEVETHYAPNIKPIRCGTGELNQVFLNLLLNAADAIADTGKRGMIKIITRQEADEAIVEISDTGVGIPHHIKDKIFTPFFTTKKMGKGTGQGLHYSYHIIVERHRGKLYFKSSAGEGTTFYIHLPIDNG